MKHKIIEVKNNACDEVALNITNDECGSTVVQITAWHQSEADEMFFQSKNVELPSFDMCEQFIEDFSEKSAEVFAGLFEF